MVLDDWLGCGLHFRHLLLLLHLVPLEWPASSPSLMSSPWVAFSAYEARRILFETYLFQLSLDQDFPLIRPLLIRTKLLSENQGQVSLGRSYETSVKVSCSRSNETQLFLSISPPRLMRKSRFFPKVQFFFDALIVGVSWKLSFAGPAKIMTWPSFAEEFRPYTKVRRWFFRRKIGLSHEPGGKSKEKAEFR